jgi:hypothetical protein
MPDELMNNPAVAATYGSLEWSKDKILGLVEKFRNRKLAFIEDHETIELVRDQRHSTEWQILSPYLADRKLRIVSQIGLTLRKLENDIEKVGRLRTKILRKYGQEGLHIAEAVQNGVLSTFIGIDMSLAQSPADMTNQIETMLNNVDKFIVFVKPEDNVDKVTREIEIRLMADVPRTLILYGCRSEARQRVHSIVKKLERTNPSYTYTISESKIKTIVIVTKASPPAAGCF